MARFKITATAPTAYQYSSLSHFGLPIKKNVEGLGSFTGSETFDTEAEAKAYLTKRAEMYFDNQVELEEALEQVENGYLTIDAVTASIDEVPTYVVAVHFGDKTEYAPSNYTNDRAYSALPENALHFDTEEEAWLYEQDVKEHAQEAGWINCTIRVEQL